MASSGKPLRADSTVDFFSESDFIVTLEYDVPSWKFPQKNDEFLRTSLMPLYQNPACPFCTHAIQRQRAKDRPATIDFKTLLEDKGAFTTGPELPVTDTHICSNCGWWLVYQNFFNSNLDAADAVHWAKRKSFDIRKADAPLQHLRDYLSKNPTKLFDVSPRALELLLADCLGDVFDCEARHVGGPGDKGIDIVLIIADEPVIVQVKRRSTPDFVEGVRVVRELLGTLLSEEVYQGIVISTANRFSKEAVRNAELPVIQSKGYSVSLYDYQTVLDIIRAGRRVDFSPWDSLWKQSGSS